MSDHDVAGVRAASKLRSEAPLEPLTVRISMAVQLTGLGRSKLYELIKSGEIETIKVGAATLVTMSSLRRLFGRGSP